MFLDIGIGIIGSITASYFFNTELTFLMLFGAIFIALLPDFDFLYFFSKKQDTKYDYKHRDYIHYPLIYIPLGSLIALILFGKIWAFIFFVSSLLHFIHDSIAIGWGVRWLWPFSKKHYAFLYLYSKKHKAGLRRLVFSFNEKSQKEYVKVHGDPNWVQNIYFKWHPIAIAEFGFFVFSLILLFTYVYAK